MFARCDRFSAMAAHRTPALQRKRRFAAASIALLFLLLSGCVTAKRFAYSGIDRNRWQHPDEVIQALQIRPGEDVADLGSGGGYFTFRLADAVGPNGKVYAVDIDKWMLDDLSSRASKDGYTSVVTVLAMRDDPRLPQDGIDLIFTCNTYHHLTDRTDYFRHAKRYLRPDGRIAVIDFNGTGVTFGHHWTKKSVIESEMDAAGYKLEKDLSFLEYQSFLIFCRADDAGCKAGTQVVTAAELY
jgi:arsenite methyltransferase